MYIYFFLDTQDVDLDAVLGELCALESQYQSTNSLLDSDKNGMCQLILYIIYNLDIICLWLSDNGLNLDEIKCFVARVVFKFP